MSPGSILIGKFPFIRGGPPPPVDSTDSKHREYQTLHILCFFLCTHTDDKV